MKLSVRLAILLGGVFFLLLNCNAQNLQAYIFCNTKDRTIGPSAKVNYASIRDYLQDVAEALHYNYQEHSLTGNQFTFANVQQSFLNSSIAPEDIVVFYICTHGFKTINDKDIFPYLSIPDSVLSAFKQHNYIEGRNPKFLLTIIEACSGYKDLDKQQQFVLQGGISQAPEPLTPANVTAIKRLFESQCEIIVTAGKPGVNTWATPVGSIFTNSFLRAIREEQNIVSPSWNSLLNRSRNYTYGATRDYKPSHYPVWLRRQCGGSAIAEQSTTPPIGFVLQGEDDVLSEDTQAVGSNEVVELVELDTLAPVIKADLNIAVTKLDEKKNPYLVELSINHNPKDSIDKVIYYLDRTMKNPVITATNFEDDFYLSLRVWGEYLIKAEVHFKNGDIYDCYNEIKFNNENNTKSNNSNKY